MVEEEPAGKRQKGEHKDPADPPVRLHVEIVATGGTIDKAYPRLTGGYAFEIDEPAAGRILERAMPMPIVYSITSVCKKDSTEITDEDRAAVLDACVKSSCTEIIITHGTDTLGETAAYLGTRHAAQLSGKRVILTGAMRPERFVDTDAHFNLGACVGALCVQPVGVYLCMNGRIHSWDRVERDMTTGLFVSKSPNGHSGAVADAAPRLKIIATGGTIDKAYPRLTGGYAFEIDEPAAGRILERINLNYEYSIVSVCKKESTEMTDEDRAAVLEACSTPDCDWIVVTHGTETLEETASYLLRKFNEADSPIRGKRIVVTGAKRPERFVDTDAHFNLGACIGVLSSAQGGVYMCVDGWSANLRL